MANTDRNDQGTNESEVWLHLAGLLVTGMRDNLNSLLVGVLESAVGEQDRTGADIAPTIASRFRRHIPLATLARGILQSADAVSKCCSERDAERGYDLDSGYILARALVERSINFAYLAICGDQEFNEWVDHSRQKSIRLLDQRQKAGSVEFRLGIEPPLDLSQSPDLVELLQRFTSKSGKEKTRWTQLSLNRRLGEIESTFADANRIVAILLQALTIVYDIGSEAQHGTLLGVEYGIVNDVNAEAKRIPLLMAVVECIFSVRLALSNFADHKDWADATKATMKEIMPRAMKSGSRGSRGWSASGTFMDTWTS